MNFSGRKNAKCGGRLIKPIENDDERHFKLKGSHIHKPDARKLSTKKVLTKLKTLAKTTNNSPRDIVVEATTNVKSATLAVLPSVKLMKRTAKRVRRSENIPKQPQTLSALFLEGEFRITSNGENFILYDNGPIEELEKIWNFSLRAQNFIWTAHSKSHHHCSNSSIQFTVCIVFHYLCNLELLLF